MILTISHLPNQRAQVKNNADKYESLLNDNNAGTPLDAESFCNRYIDPIGAEAGTVTYVILVAYMHADTLPSRSHPSDCSVPGA